MPVVRIRWLAAAAAILAAAASAGCGFGPGEGSGGEATLTVTRDYGAEPLLEAVAPDPPESETVIRLLDREAEIATRFGGGFVHSIDGVKGELAGGRRHDWFFFVDGIESSRGAAEVAVRGGDRIWWDYRDWTDALRTPAVVGSWPEPFAQASAGAEQAPVKVVCAGARGPCDEAAARLAAEGVDASVASSPAEDSQSGTSLRLLVGPWSEVRRDPTAALLAEGPETSGVFAHFARGSGGWQLVGLDPHAEEVDRLGPGAGIVAALRKGEDPPTWVVAGVDAPGVAAAVELLDADSLANRYAVAVDGEEAIRLPVETD